MTATPGLARPAIGRSTERVEDERLITGAGCYVGDVAREGQLWARIVRSQVAHGRIQAVHLNAARARPDVVAVFAAADIPDLPSWRIPLRLEAGEVADLPEQALQPVLAIERVRYVGEPVAVVVATDPYAAEDAAADVWVEIEELEPLVDAQAALDSELILHERGDASAAGPGSNVALELGFENGDDLDALFAAADVVVSEQFRVHRHAATPMENRGLVAELGADGRLTVWGPTKVKHFNRTVVADFLRLAPEQLRFIEPDVGGGFGARGELYPEDILIPWLALRLGRPVKWLEDRAEALVASNQSREQQINLEVAATADGRLLGFRARNLINLGAYVRTNAIAPTMLGALCLAGPYRWQAFSADARGVVTNKTPLGTFRGPGEVEATFARERMLDILAGRVGLEPLELRRRNLIRAEELPYSFSLGEGEPPMVFGSGDFHAQLDAALERIDYKGLRAQTREASSRAQDDERLGVGIACSMSTGGIGSFEWARVIAEPDGTFTGLVGSGGVGQGLRTSLAQVLADALEVDIERVRIRHSDTDEIVDGEGSYGDRGMIFGTGALHLAIDDMHASVRPAAARALGVAEEELELAGERVWARGNPDAATTLGAFGATGTGRYKADTGAGTQSFCATAALVSVDIRTGRVRVLDYAGAYDAGRIVNPLTLEGQLTGAAAQGIAGILFEESAYDENGQPLAGSFMDYVLPTVAEMPRIESLVFEYPDPDTPLGIKGGGNSGIICTHAVVANAVADALGDAGECLTQLPLRANAVRALLRDAGGDR